MVTFLNSFSRALHSLYSSDANYVFHGHLLVAHTKTTITPKTHIETTTETTTEAQAKTTAAVE